MHMTLTLVQLSDVHVIFFSAAFIALRSIVICDLLGVTKLSNALGLLLLFQGLASIIGTPLSGKGACTDTAQKSQ